MTILGWHFLADTGLLRDGRTPPPDGEWLEHEGEIVPCKSGLYASVRAFDAVRGSPGSIVCRVELDGDVVEHEGNKHVGRRRRILWRADASATLRLFARRQALSVLHLWDAPDVVREFLVTGDESLRKVAHEAAYAEHEPVWNSVPDAARSAAWASTLGTVRHAAIYSTWSAGWVAARDATSAEERTAAWDAAQDAANDMLTEMLMDLGPKEVAR